jgi:hypothetical protein
MAGLGPAIHDFDFARLQRKTWMPGIKPGTTVTKDVDARAKPAHDESVHPRLRR